MRLYETSDADFYVDVPNSWERYCSYPPEKEWSYRNLKPVKSINYYRDIEGSRIDKMTRKDLYLGEKPKNRINPWACLPLFYSTGSRFIRLEKAKPSGFKCAEFPLNIVEAKKKLEQEQEKAVVEQRKQYIRDRFKWACNRENKFRK